MPRPRLELVRIWRLALLKALSPALLLGFAQTATLQEFANIDLAKAIESAGSPHSQPLPVLAVRFSPDGRKLAVVTDWYGTRESQRSRLLVFDVSQRPALLASFEVRAGVNENDETGPASNFGWSPSGDLINADGTLIRMSDASRCELPSGTVLVSGNFAIAPDPSPWNWKALASKLELFNTRCEAIGAWDRPGRWAITDVSLDLGLLSVAKIVGFPNQAEDLIADPAARKVVQQWSGPAQPGGWFADSGKAICKGGAADSVSHVPVTCWEADSGRRIAQAPDANGREPIASAAHASRIVVSDYHLQRVPLSAEYGEVLDRRVVWDFRAGRELASWRPPWQTWEFPRYSSGSGPPRRVKEPFRFAISPDGECVAEGGDGRVHLYRIAIAPGR